MTDIKGIGISAGQRAAGGSAQPGPDAESPMRKLGRKLAEAGSSLATKTPTNYDPKEIADALKEHAAKQEMKEALREIAGKIRKSTAPEPPIVPPLQPNPPAPVSPEIGPTPS